MRDYHGENTARKLFFNPTQVSREIRVPNIRAAVYWRNKTIIKHSVGLDTLFNVLKLINFDCLVCFVLGFCVLSIGVFRVCISV